MNGKVDSARVDYGSRQPPPDIEPDPYVPPPRKPPMDRSTVWFVAIGILAIAFILWAIVGISHHPTSDGYGIPLATKGETK